MGEGMPILVSTFVMVLALSMAPASVLAQGAPKSSTCPEGQAKCIENCAKVGGQARFCPQWCSEKKKCTG
jgi:hypothetical protein